VPDLLAAERRSTCTQHRLQATRGHVSGRSLAARIAYTDREARQLVVPRPIVGLPTAGLRIVAFQRLGQAFSWSVSQSPKLFLSRDMCAFHGQDGLPGRYPRFVVEIGRRFVSLTSS